MSNQQEGVVLDAHEVVMRTINQDQLKPGNYDLSGEAPLEVVTAMATLEGHARRSHGKMFIVGQTVYRMAGGCLEVTRGVKRLRTYR